MMILFNKNSLLHMRKIKDCVTDFKSSGETPDSAHRILREIIKEIPELVRTRNAQGSEAMLAILNQADDRWHSFVQQAKIPEFRYAFRQVQLKISPEVYFIWVQAFPGRQLPHPAKLGRSQTDLGL
jgi:hypothetical protein